MPTPVLSRRRTVRPLRAGLLLAAALLLATAPRAAAAQRQGDAGTAVILGVVRDAAGRPMAGVHVAASDVPRGVYTRDDGTFALPPVRPGVQLVRARRIGYAAEGTTMVLAAGDTADLRITLLSVHELPTVVTAAERRRARKFEAFERRRTSGFGSFVTRAELDRWHTARPSDALRRVAGLQMEIDERGRKRLVMSRAQALGGSCPPLYYVDGVRWMVSDDTDVDFSLPSVEEIEGIEVYKGAATVPTELNASGAACGVIAIWTR